ncbi:MAG: hypothetical protein LBD88_02495 [Candidatus Peribacteria bacterium]|jgi:hypothetical protein|nr:hypothetical protein [Candidatus Peribacteria bacterium]
MMIMMNSLEYEKYSDKLTKIYPSLSVEERKRIFDLRVDFWQMIIENYKNLTIS